MGKDADDTLMSTNITAVERKQYQSVTAKLDTFQQARFNCRIQRVFASRSMTETKRQY